MVILNEAEIRGLVDVDGARAAIAAAFLALHRGDATIADVISLPFADPRGVAHIKAGHVHSDTVWTAKVSADFYPADGNSTAHSGLMLVLSAVDGRLVGLLLDNGFLTELRTGAAGAIAAELLAREDSSQLAIVGAGSQARYQLDALLKVRSIADVRIASRTRARAELFAKEIAARRGPTVKLCDSVEEAVRGADIVVTTTPASEPIVEASWLDPGTHVTAVGSDEPAKQELSVEILARADIVAVDDRGQAARYGELHHAVEGGFRTATDAVTIGELLDGAATGRTRADEVTLADLTGVGVQDAAIAALVLHNAVKAEAARFRADDREDHSAVLQVPPPAVSDASN